MNDISLDGAMYTIYKPTVKFLPPPPAPRTLIVCKFLKILMVSDKTIHKVFRIKLYKFVNKTIREFSYFHYLPKLYFGFKEEIQTRFNLISEERVKNFEQNTENLMKLG